MTTTRQPPTTAPPDGYADSLAELKAHIHGVHQRAALAVKREPMPLCWQIGRDILHRQSREEWGAKVVDRLACELLRWLQVAGRLAQLGERGGAHCTLAGPVEG